MSKSLIQTLRGFHVAIALFAVAFTQHALAQTGTGGALAGRVRNSLRGVFLNNARLTVEGTNREVFTNDYGEYIISDLPAGAVTLHVFYTGFAPKTVQATVVAGQRAQQDVDLSPAQSTDDVVRLDPFVVAEQREMTGRAIAINEQRFAPNLKNVVATDEFGNVPDGSVGQFLKFLPGVTANYTANEVTSIALRGLPASTTPVMMDGNRMATPSTDSNSRAFDPGRASINNLARVEIIKSPTPDMPADSFGGAINFISKSAFEHAHPLFAFSASANANSNAMTLGQTYGPGRDQTRKILPDVDFTYINPLTKNFGFTLTGLHSDRYIPEERTQMDWRPTGAAGAFGTATSPAFAGVSLVAGPQTTSRSSLGGSFDWKITPDNVLTFDSQWSTSDAFFANQGPSFKAIGTNNNSPTDYGPDFTQGAAGAGLFSHGTSFRRKTGTTYHLSLNFRHDGPVWKLDGGAYFSHATDKYRDIENGYFDAVILQLKNVTARFDDVSNKGTRITTTTAAGAPVDWQSLANYTIVSGNTVPVDATDVVKGAHVNASRSFDLGVPVTVKSGLDVRQQDRDTTKRAQLWNFVGPDGKAGTADDLAGRYDVVETGSSSQATPLGYIQWPSPYKLLDLLKSHPEWWAQDDNFNVVQNTSGSKKITERVSSAYIRADTHLLNNRLALTAGVRYERTDDEGYGLLNDVSAGYQKDANGKVVLDNAGKPVKITTDPGQLLRLQYVERGAHDKRNYGDFYPSLNATYNLTDKLLLRGAYARTIARPDFNNIVPGTVVSDPTAASPAITVNNTGLKPWTANNYDLSLEYYFEPAGVLSVGVYRKDIADFFGTVSTPATPELLSLYGLDSSYSNYNVVYKDNVGAARVDGVELNYTQGLTFLPNWARGVQVFANLTSQRLQGSTTADFSDFISRNINWGASLSRSRYTVKLNWNYRGRQRLTAVTGAGVPPGDFDYYAPRIFLDTDFEYRFTKQLSFFLAVRNLTGSARLRERYSDNTPDYATRYFDQRFGVQYFSGIKGSF